MGALVWSKIGLKVGFPVTSVGDNVGFKLGMLFGDRDGFPVSSDEGAKDGEM